MGGKNTQENAGIAQQQMMQAAPQSGGGFGKSDPNSPAAPRYPARSDLTGEMAAQMYANRPQQTSPWGDQNATMGGPGGNMESFANRPQQVSPMQQQTGNAAPPPASPGMQAPELPQQAAPQAQANSNRNARQRNMIRGGNIANSNANAAARQQMQGTPAPQAAQPQQQSPAGPAEAGPQGVQRQRQLAQMMRGQ